MKKPCNVTLRHKSPLLLAFSFAVVLAVGPVAPVEAQRTPDGILDRADRFFQAENYGASATEYQRFLFFAREHSAAYYAYYRLGLAEYRLGRFEEAIRAFRQSAQSSTASPNHRRHTRYRLGLAYLEANQLERAKLEVLSLVMSARDTVLATQASLIAGLAYAFQDRWEQADEMWQRTVALQKDNEPFQRKIAQAQTVADQLETEPTLASPTRAKWASTFLPGSGQVYAGSVRDGLSALAVNTGSSYMVYRSLSAGSYISAVTLATSLWWRYYQGNRNRAEDAATQANRDHRQRLEEKLYDFVKEAGQFLPAHRYMPKRPG
jgi:tetratricopeptide (TPR) repeat protein